MGQCLLDRRLLLNQYDPYTSLLIHFDGTNGSTTLKDNSQYNQTITAHGNAQISTAQYKFGGSSGLFDGSGDYLTAPSISAYNFGSGDFTIDCWIRHGSSSVDYGILNKGDFSTSTRAFDFFIYGPSGSRRPFFSYTSDGSTTTTVQGSGIDLLADTWYHLAVVRYGTSLKIYVNGTSVASNTIGSAFIYSNSNALYIGALYSGGLSSYYNGYMDELRISKGIARWTSNFTPPISAYRR